MITTHVNPDGDGVGSAVALAARLRDRGTEASIVTPGPAPESLHFLLDGVPAFAATDPAATDPLQSSDLVAILDTAERHRLGRVGEYLEGRGGVLIDHHPPIGDPLVEPAVRDPSACATGELIFDLLMLDGSPLTREEADALYVAIATDTGSFQFANTSVRTHQIAGSLLEAGVDPEAMYGRLYGVYTRNRLALLQHALSALEVDPELPVAWIALDHRTLRDASATSDDLEGLVEYPRRLAGIEVGVFFRGLSRDRTKVSLRSNGRVDVSGVARALGGGGHTKASGVLVEAGLEEAIQTVLGVLRPAVRAALNDAVESTDDPAGTLP